MSNYVKDRVPRVRALKAAGNSEFDCQYYADHWSELQFETKNRLLNFRPDLVRSLDANLEGEGY